MPLSPIRCLVLVVAGAVIGGENRAHGVPYEVFIDVDDEQDLYDLRNSGQISTRSFDALLLLLQTQVDLNRADRDRLYALPNLELVDVDAILRVRRREGSIRSIDALTAHGALSERQAEAIRAFVTGVGRRDRERVGGFLRAQAQTTGPHGRQPPAIAVQARIEALGHLETAIVAVLARNAVGGVRWDPLRGGLSVSPERPHLVVPKFYLAWNGDRWGLVVGTYRIGFGQRLTFDVTDQTLPNGFFGDLEVRRGDSLVARCRRRAGELTMTPCPSDRSKRVGPDFGWTERLTGVAVGLKRAPVGRGTLQAYVWLSHQVLGVQAYEVVNRTTCADPRNDDDPGCRAPPAFVRDRDGPQPVLSAGTVPRVTAEVLGGANVGFSPRSRTRIGTTAYGAVPRWLIGGVRLGYQESARRPFGGVFGAVGADFVHGFRSQNFFGEVSRSFDSQPNGGDFAAIARSVTDLQRTELDASVRYYGPGFANPYARSDSAPDEREGLRTRDELGARLRTSSRLGPRVSLRTFSDVWRRVTGGSTRADLYARLDFAFSGRWSWGAWWSYRRSSLEQWTAATLASFRLDARLRLVAQLVHDWRGVATDAKRRDVGVLLDMFARPTTRLRIRLRLRYDFEGVASRGRRVETWWGYARLTGVFRSRDRIGIRYDVRGFLEPRVPTRRRVPNPEHWLWLEYRVRF